MARSKLLILILALSLLPGACNLPQTITSETTAIPPLVFPTREAEFTPLPTRPPYSPAELVDYTAQAGDTLPSLARHFNTTEAEIRTANPVIPKNVSTMPPGLPMKIPIYYLPLWGTAYQILPDSLYVNGPDSMDFDLEGFIEAAPGWLKTYREARPEGYFTAAQVIRLVSSHFSISPRLQLALLEYFAQGLSNPTPPATEYILGYESALHKGLYMQLVWAANTLNNGYYGWRRGSLVEFETPDTRIQRPDPWQNAASVALQYFFSRSYSIPQYDEMIGPGGLAQTYKKLFGDPWQNIHPHIPGSLAQPDFYLPFEPGKGWNYTGGPHNAWGSGEPLAAIDFAPNGVQGCGDSMEWVTAMTDGLVVRSGEGEVVVDLDGDGSELTGWNIFYLHLASLDRVRAGVHIQAGERIGHPSCEGGESTGTHVHLARKYNGEWILADSPLPFTLEGWVVKNGKDIYKGTLVRFSDVITASSKAEGFSYIISDRK